MIYKSYTFEDQVMRAFINADDKIYIDIDSDDSNDPVSAQFIVLDINEAKDFVSYLDGLIKEIIKCNG